MVAIEWIVLNWRLVASGAAFLSVLGGAAYMHHSIYQNGYKACQSVQAAAIPAAIKERAKYDHITATMDAAQLDALGRAHGWVRPDSDR